MSCVYPILLNVYAKLRVSSVNSPQVPFQCSYSFHLSACSLPMLLFLPPITLFPSNAIIAFIYQHVPFHCSYSFHPSLCSLPMLLLLSFINMFPSKVMFLLFFTMFPCHAPVSLTLFLLLPLAYYFHSSHPPILPDSHK